MPERDKIMKPGYLIVLLIVGIVIAVLYWRFPYALEVERDQARLVYLSLLASGVGLSLWSRKEAWHVSLKQATVWFAIIMGLVVVYSYKDMFLQSKLAANLMPQVAFNAAGGAMTLQKSDDGHFYLEAAVNGVRVLFMVDTGASDIVLSPSDAARAGLKDYDLDFIKVYTTANGTVRGAPVRLARVQIGDSVFRDLPASVNESGMEHSLLGMAFLNRFGQVSFKGDTLTLEP